MEESLTLWVKDLIMPKEQSDRGSQNLHLAVILLYFLLVLLFLVARLAQVRE